MTTFVFCNTCGNRWKFCWKKVYFCSVGARFSTSDSVGRYVSSARLRGTWCICAYVSFCTLCTHSYMWSWHCVGRTMKHILQTICGDRVYVIFLILGFIIMYLYMCVFIDKERFINIFLQSLLCRGQYSTIILYYLSDEKNFGFTSIIWKCSAFLCPCYRRMSEFLNRFYLCPWFHSLRHYVCLHMQSYPGWPPLGVEIT